jgi:hypothetical protein
MVESGITEAGIYNIGYQVGMVMLLLVNAVANFFQPFLYERLSNINRESQIEIVKNYLYHYNWGYLFPGRHFISITAFYLSTLLMIVIVKEISMYSGRA